MVWYLPATWFELTDKFTRVTKYNIRVDDGVVYASAKFTGRHPSETSPVYEMTGTSAFSVWDAKKSWEHLVRNFSYDKPHVGLYGQLV